MILVVHVTVVNPATRLPEILRLTSGKHYVHEGRCYIPNVRAGFNFEQNLYSKGTTSGEVTVGHGTLEIDNLDGRLDYLRTYGIAGHPVVAWLVPDEDTPFTDDDLYYTGVTFYPELSLEVLGLKIVSKMQEMDTPFSEATFAGDNAGPVGLEGGEDLKGKRKPAIYGRIFNMAPVQVNSSLLIYACNYDKDGVRKAVNRVLTVRDAGGVLLDEGDVADAATLQAASVTDGYFKTCLAEGLIMLGEVPVGDVTADVYESDGEESSAPRVVKRILQDVMGYTSGTDFQPGELNSLHVKNSAPVGIVIDGNQTTLSAVAQILDAIGGWMCPDSRGVFHFGRVEDPEEMGSSATITPDHYLENSLSRVPTNDSGRNIPAFKVKLSHSRNWATLGKKEILESVDIDDKERLSTEYRDVVTEDVTIKEIHPQAAFIEYDTLLVTAMEPLEELPGLTPQEECDRRFSIQSKTQERYLLSVDFSTFRGIRVGTCVTLISDRLELSTGKPFILLGRKDDLDDQKIELDIYAINTY